MKDAVFVYTIKDVLVVTSVVLLIVGLIGGLLAEKVYFWWQAQYKESNRKLRKEFPGMCDDHEYLGVKKCPQCVKDDL